MLGYYKSVHGLTYLLNTARIKVTVEFDEKPRFELEKEFQMYRITLEVINNIIRHANSTGIFITAKGADENNEDIISIKYNDKGITSGEVRELSLQGGLGLTSIESRAQLINLEIQYLVHNNNSSEVLLCLRKEKRVMAVN
jgi:signal transduction histidine kinase